MKLHVSQVYTITGFMISMANTTMFTTYAVYYIMTLGLNPFQLLMVGTVLELTVLIFEGITGVIADTYSRRTSVIIGMFVVGGAFVLKGSVIWLPMLSPMISLFIGLLIAEAIRGMGETFISGAHSAWIVDEVGEENVGRIFLRAKRLSLFGTLTGIALSVGLSTVATNLPYLIGGMIYLGVGVFLVFFMKETKFVRSARAADPSNWQNMKTMWLSGTKVISGNPLLLMILVVTLFSGASSEGYDRLWEAHLIKEVGFPLGNTLPISAWLGLIAVLSTCLSLFTMWIAEKRLDMGSQRVVFVGMFVLTAARMAALLSFGFSPNFAWALVSVLVLGAIRTLSAPIYDTWLNLNIDSKSRATVLSMMSQSDALGQTCGGPLVGWVGNRFSIRTSLVIAAVLLSPILVAFSRVLRKR
ncbi:Major Facilitator Superfamily protein [Paenibacillus sp. yr247]|uniref:MFS transporter n=1 Tax=Paenibacillus sp. yr247 TaxID=1761880 RepID=UPI00088A649B|nr:MFS transporter [Paenibacillus sp. yr247]SDN21652.1 Major Facilitator Superfamily protein [Paenibacillus sp. yr247]